MYYRGFPLNEFSQISDNEISDATPYFLKKTSFDIQASNVFERVLNKKVDLVVYQDILWDDKKLLEYHSYNYNGIPFYTENKVGKNVYKTTIISSDCNISGVNIIQYDDLFRPIIEQIFDENHLLLEYRKFFYNENNREAIKEKIFFSSWNISEEIY